MTLDRSYIGYLCFLGIDIFKSVLMYSNGAICLIKLFFKMGLFTVHWPETFVQTPFFFKALIALLYKILEINSCTTKILQISPVFCASIVARTFEKGKIKKFCL
jgi:hypothetical protein